MSANPVVKWVGGKTKLLPELLARIPARFGRYYEPFAGGAALFFRLAPDRAVLGDLNSDLMGMYGALATDVAAVIRSLLRHEVSHSAHHYYGTRDRWNARRASWTAATRASTMIYMNRTGYNGLWRVNRRAEFNVPMGRPSGCHEIPTICVPDALRAAHSVLARAELRSGDYRTTVTDAARGDLVYLDPPYMPVSRTANFTTYAAAGFGPGDHRALADTARQLVARGCHVVLSNSDTPYVRSLYKGFKIDRVKCARSINSNAAKRGDVDELIIIGNAGASPRRSR